MSPFPSDDALLTATQKASIVRHALKIEDEVTHRINQIILLAEYSPPSVPMPRLRIMNTRRFTALFAECVQSALVDSENLTVGMLKQQFLQSQQMLMDRLHQDGFSDTNAITITARGCYESVCNNLLASIVRPDPVRRTKEEKRRARVRLTSHIADWLTEPFTDTMIGWLQTNGQLIPLYFEVGWKTRVEQQPSEILKAAYPQIADIYNSFLREAFNTDPPPDSRQFEERMEHKEEDLPATLKQALPELDPEQHEVLAQICVDFRKKVLAINIKKQMRLHMDRSAATGGPDI